MDVKDFLGEKVWFDGSGAGYFWGENPEGGCQMIGEIRGWGAIQNLFKQKDGSIDFESAEKFQDSVGYFIAEAINEKLEKERKKGKKEIDNPNQIDSLDSIREIENSDG
jgi:hypothetical protein